MKQTIIDILNKISTDVPEIQYVRVFNNQFQYLEDQTIEAFPFPCAFVEVIPQSYVQLGAGYQQSDIDIKIHIGHVEYDANNGNMEENLSIFDIRNLVVKELNLFKPYMCAEMFKVSEEQDYTHTDVYHYVITYRTGLIDDTGSTLINPTLVEPLQIEVDVALNDNLDRENPDRHEIIIL